MLETHIMMRLRVVVVVVYDLGVDGLVDVRLVLVRLVLQHWVVVVVCLVMGVVERRLLVGDLVVVQGLQVVVMMRIRGQAVVMMLLVLLLLVVMQGLGGLERLRGRNDGDVAGVCVCARTGARAG